MKPLPDKDGNTSGWWDKYDRWHMGVAATHTENFTPSGPNYCQECSDAAGNWVKWPCSASRHLALTQTSLPASDDSAAPVLPTSVAPAGEDYGAHVFDLVPSIAVYGQEKFSEGVKAARDAVAAVWSAPDGLLRGLCNHADAVAAIDAVPMSDPPPTVEPELNDTPTGLLATNTVDK